MFPQNATIQNMMYCTIEDNTILQCNYGQPLKKIGVTMEKYNDALNLLSEYRNKLIELGVIEKEKTPEDLQKETNALLLKLNARMDKMEEKFNEYQRSNSNCVQPTSGATQTASSASVGPRGEYFSYSKIEELSRRNPELAKYDINDVYYVINMLHSDFYKPKWDVDTYVMFALMWLDDPDAKPGKAKLHAEVFHGV